MSYMAGIEAGGTKFICAIGDSEGKIFKKVRIETTTPDATIDEVVSFFKSQQKQYPLDAVGCGAFGPIDPNKNSKSYGLITSTPKLHWKDFNIVKALSEKLQLPIGFDTDVNAAALGEYYWGSARGLTDFIYLTVGTGIGGGAMVNGNLLHGAMHAEMGHILIPQDKTKDPFEGICPYHKNCLEGLASGPAIKARWQVESALMLDKSHPGWEIEADYLSIALTNYIMTLSPQRIILGGGVMKQQHLFPLIRQKVKQKLNQYIVNEMIDNLEKTIVPVSLGDNTGVMGALALAKRAHLEYELYS
ncbi:ROK family protein [Thiotrichales bacterium 19S3-7]|nr:ROK family protein [Thiotrichales bacterium 19S3-7]MCF6801093.1 ROK family protein [Thiotrichales bacterium 19S3-11]